MSETVHSVEWYFTEAIALNDLPKVKALVASHSLPSGGYTILLDAVKFGRNGIVQFLLEKGAQVTSSRKYVTDSLLHNAFAKKDAELARILLASDAVVVDASEGYGVLFNAVKERRTDLAVCLLEKGVPVNDPRKCIPHENTPLHFAVEHGNLTLVQRLIEHNAAIDAFNVQQETPLHIASRNDRKDIASMLLMKGAGSLQNKSTFEPLHVACIEKSVNMVALFLSARLPSEFLNPRSLFRALCLASLNDSEEIMSLLLSAGAHSNILESDFDRSGSFPIHLACEKGHLSIVKLLIEYRREFIHLVRSSNGFTPLHVACENGHEEIVSYLLTKQADLNICAKNGSTPLHLVAGKGNLEIVELLCENGANVNAELKDGSTALLAAVKNGHTEVAKMLLFRGATVNVKDSEGCTPLHFSLDYNDGSLRRCILEMKPFVDEKVSGSLLDTFNQDASLVWTKGPNYYAGVDDKDILNHDKDAMIAYSITSKYSRADSFPLDKAIALRHQKTVEALLACGVSLEDKNFSSPPLHLAVQKGHYGITEILLKAGCAVNGKDKKGKTPIHYLFDIPPKPSSGRKSTGGRAPRRGPDRPHRLGFKFDIFQLLIDSGALLNDVPYPLHLAAKRDDIKICKYLIENGVANVNARDKSGETPLFHAAVCDQGQGEVPRYLLSNGADTTVRDNNGDTALHRAATTYSKYNQAALALIEFKADVNAKNKEGSTPLHCAVERRNFVETVESMLKNGATVDVPRGTDGARPLHIAAKEKGDEIVKLLLAFHADVDAKDARGRTAFQWAFPSYWSNNVIALLLEHDHEMNILDGSGEAKWQKFVQDTINDDKNRKAVTEHMLKLKAAGFLISEGIEFLIREQCTKYGDDCEQFERRCKEELEIMKQLPLCCDLSLHDALVDSNHLAFKAYDSVVHSLESIAFDEFPIYGRLIENKAKRNRMINASKNALNFLIKTRSVLYQERVPNVPAEVLLQIVSYCDWNSLRCLTECNDALKQQLLLLAETRREVTATIASRTRGRRKNIKKT